MSGRRVSRFRSFHERLEYPREDTRPEFQIDSVVLECEQNGDDKGKPRLRLSHGSRGDADISVCVFREGADVDLLIDALASARRAVFGLPTFAEERSEERERQEERERADKERNRTILSFGKE